MAKVSFKLVPPELDQTYKSALQSGDRFTYSVIKTKSPFVSRNSKKGLSQKSLMPILAPVWANFDTNTKNNWNSAGAREGLTGWKEFLKDTALRRANDGTGYSTPQTDRQCNVGRMHVESPATGFTLEQLHPNSYYVRKKVRGTKSQYNPQIVTEHLYIPLTIGISYRASLTQLTGGGSARFYAEVYSHYQGRDLVTVLELPFNLDGNWHIDEVTMSQCFGVVRGYTVFIEILNCHGDLYFDNVKIIHSGLNWARDAHCNNISQTFTNAFYQVTKAWGVDSLPDGCYYHSFYYGMM